MDEINKYRELENWYECANSVNEIPAESEKVLFYRRKDSHKGISRYQKIRKLSANQVNQDFLNEISKLKNLEYLEIEVITAEDLSPLTGLFNLRTLKLDSVRKATDFSPLLNIKALDKLFIENAKHLTNLEFLSNAHKLVVLGIEGGMYTTQKIESLKPLSNLKKLEALFMSSVQLKDKNLDYLASIPNLKIFDCARFTPKKSFDSLRKLMPNLVCIWCDKYEIDI